MNSPGLLVLSSAPGSTLLWNPHTLVTLSAHKPGSAPGAALCPYGAGWIAVSRDRKTLKYFQQDQEESVGEVKVQQGVNCVTAWRYLVAVGMNDGAVELWDSRTGGMLLTVAGPSGVTAVVLNESQLLVGRADGSVSEHVLSSLYAGQTDPRFLTRPHTAPVSALKLDRHRALSASADQSIAVLQAGKVTHSLKCDSNLTCLDCDGKRVVAGGSDGSVYCFAGVQSKWKWQESPVTAVGLLDRELLVAATHIFVLSVQTGAVLRTYEGHKAAVSAMVLFDPVSEFAPTVRLMNPKETSPLRVSLQADHFPPPSEAPATTTPEEDLEKLKSMNQWIYSLWVDGWL